MLAIAYMSAHMYIESIYEDIYMRAHTRTYIWTLVLARIRSFIIHIRDIVGHIRERKLQKGH